MRYFVTGGLGVVGSQFSSEMLSAGHEVVILDACEEPRNVWALHELKNTYGNNVHIRSERMETANLDDVVDCDGILHAAAFTGIPQSTKNPDDDWVSNVDATRRLLETLRRAKEAGKRVPPVVALSSVKPYKVDDVAYEQATTRYKWLKTTRPGFDPQYGFDENTLLSPDEPYAASKMAQSALCMAYGRSYGLPITVFRCSNLYGAAPCHGPRHGWLTWFCISAVLGRPLQRQGTGMQVRDMLFSSDITSAVLKAFTLGSTGAVFNLGGGIQNTVSVNEAITKLSFKVPSITITNGPGREHEDPIFITDTRKFSTATGWRPLVDVNAGIVRICAWAEQHRDDLLKIYEGV